MNFSILAGKKILAVEDNTINQMLVRHALQKPGVIIDIANHGNEALQYLSKNTYDGILMDIHMPELDGYQTTQVIREELKMDIPIVAMTALALKGEEDKCLNLGMNGYISKPFTIDSLCNELIRVFSAQHKSTKNTFLIAGNGVEIDLGFLYSIANNDATYIMNMLQMYLDTMPKNFEQLQDAITNNNYNHCYRLLHQIKTTLAVVQVKELNDWVTQAELVIKNMNGIDTIAETLPLLQDTYQQTAHLIQKQLSHVALEAQVA